MRRCFSLLEVVVASTLFATVIALSFGVCGRTSENMGETMAISDVAMKSNRLAESLTGYLRSAQSFALSATAAPNTDFTAVQFRQVLGYDFDGEDDDGTQNDGVARTPVRLIRFVYDAGEGTTEGADDDGDGLVDEGTLELREDKNDDGDATDSDELLAILATDVEGDSLSFVNQPSGGASPDPGDAFLQVSYTLLRRLPREGEVYRFSATLEIAFRNTLD